MAEVAGSSLLFIAYKFPPMHSTSCVRTWGICKHLQAHFDKVAVLTTSNRHILRQEAVDIGEVEVHDAKTYDYRTAFQKDVQQQSATSVQSKKSLGGRFAQKLVSSFPFLYVFGEGGWSYIRSGINIGRKLIREKGITHVMSSFSPYADHIIAHALKREFPEITWIADFRDLHVDPTQSNLLFRAYQEKINKRILAEATILTTVSEGLARHLERYHQNVYVLRNGIEAGKIAEDLPESDKFTVTYTGSMFGNKRDPGVLARALKRLSADPEFRGNLRIRYAGKDAGHWNSYFEKADLGDNLENQGLVTRKEALRLQRVSHINILLTYSSNELKGNVTGKIYEYMAAGRPMVLCINGPKDTELEMAVEDYPAFVAYNEDEKALAEYLRGYYDKWMNSEEEEYITPASNSSHSWDSVIQDFISKISGMKPDLN